MSQLTSEPTADTTTDYTLTALDRCDSCGAQAYIRVEVATGELLFCNHHGRKYQEKLEAVATSWHDESERLTSGADAR